MNKLFGQFVPWFTIQWISSTNGKIQFKSDFEKKTSYNHKKNKFHISFWRVHDERFYS